MRFPYTALIATALAGAMFSAAPAGAQQSAGGVTGKSTPPPAATRPRGFDYWQPDWMVRELWGPGRMPKSMMVRLLRHQTYMRFGVPDDYSGARSPMKPGPAEIAAGSRLYAKSCASCHGRDGTGGGEAGNALAPSPALLAFMITRPVSVDEYLMWAISDGGKAFGSDMPAFKDKLQRDDIWRIIAYMRAGFPQADDKAGK